MNKQQYATIYIVRHGETDWNVVHKIQGHTDTSLNKRGELQAKNLGKKLKNISFEAIFSSDLQRAKKTAEIMILEKKLAVTTTAVLREKYFGSLEGKQSKEFLKLDKLRDLLEKEKQMSFKHVPDMESDEEVIGRLLTFLREVAVAYIGKNVLMVTHGGLLRALLLHLGVFTYSDYLIVENTAFLKVAADGIDFFVEEINGITKQ